MQWRFEIVDIDGDVVHARCQGCGYILEVIAVLAFGFRAATLLRLDIQGLGKNTLGARSLHNLAEAAMERLDIDEPRIEGATRTSGARPGRQPAPIVFRRR